MISETNFTDMRDFLEDAFKQNSSDILALNKYCKDGKSFLACTYLLNQQSIKEGIPNYLVVVFEDLPQPYPQEILEKIKQYLDSKNFQCEFITWSTYESFTPNYA